MSRDALKLEGKIKPAVFLILGFVSIFGTHDRSGSSLGRKEKREGGGRSDSYLYSQYSEVRVTLDDLGDATALRGIPRFVGDGLLNMPQLFTR